MRVESKCCNDLFQLIMNYFYIIYSLNLISEKLKRKYIIWFLFIFHPMKNIIRTYYKYTGSDNVPWSHPNVPKPFWFLSNHFLNIIYKSMTINKNINSNLIPIFDWWYIRVIRPSNTVNPWNDNYLKKTNYQQRNSTHPIVNQSQNKKSTLFKFFKL